MVGCYNNVHELPKRQRVPEPTDQLTNRAADTAARIVVVRMWQIIGAAVTAGAGLLSGAWSFWNIQDGIRNLKSSFEYRLAPIEKKVDELAAWKDSEMERRQREEGRESERRDACLTGAYKDPTRCISVLSPGELDALRKRGDE